MPDSAVDLHVGTAGWSYADWEGIVFPRGRQKPVDSLNYLASYLTCIEINSSFYRIPSPKVVEGWIRSIDSLDSFLFTVKMWRGFTHGDPGDWNRKNREAFDTILKCLQDAGRLGAVLVQFPWFFQHSSDNRSLVDRIADRYGSYPLVLEVRHDSWITAESLEALTKMGYNLCNIDLPQARNSVKPSSIVTGSVGYVRLHGRNADAWFDARAGRDDKYNYLYSRQELDDWTERVREIRKSAQRTFVVADNHYKGKAAANALELRSKLEKRKVAVPEPLVVAYPRLQKISVTRYSLFDQ